MTGLHQSAQIIRGLIEVCRETHEGFRSAAESAPNSTLKNLLQLYAQQRSRFADELRGFASQDPTTSTGNVRSRHSGASTEEADRLQTCLEKERSLLALYRNALAGRTLPTKAHFHVSAQLAL